MEAKVLLTYQVWTGRVAKQPEPKIVDLIVNETKTFKVTAGSLKETDDEDFNLSLEPLDKGAVKLKYKHLVIREDDKGTDLKAQNNGEIVLDKGRSIKLGTATYDAGANVEINIQ